MDYLFVLRCPSQAGLWVADAISLLDDSNCIKDCNAWNQRFEPHLNYKAFDRDIVDDDIEILHA